MFVFGAEKIDSGIIRAFLERYEERCVQLCAIVRNPQNSSSTISPNIQNEQNRRTPKQDIFVFSNSCVVKSENDIFGVISIGMTIFHCLPFLNSKKKNDDFNAAFFSVISSAKNPVISSAVEKSIKNIRCVHGEKSASDYIINLLVSSGKSIYQKNEYFYMTKNDLDGLPLPASLLCMGEEIVCCNLDHADDLYDLQKNYLIEEVAPKGVKTTDEYARSNIENILREQKLFAISSDGQFVAKANTNAIGWNWIQIGGVYTNPLYRRNNYALCLVSTLVRHIIKNGRKTCLFVNKKNVPAVSLYKKMDFTTVCEFVICYLE